MKRQLLLTYDYELFLGRRSGSVLECQVTPTNKTVDILNRFGSKGVFFVDTTHLIRLKENKSSTASKNDFEIIANQIQKLIVSGHYVFPHIHPHWLDAKYLSQTNEWELLNTSRYCFHQCNEADRSLVFNESISILKEIISSVSPGYKVDCYRAGGWSIQPFFNFKKYFTEHSIKYDMSVLGGFYSFSDAQYFDFANAPRKGIYRFENDECIEDKNGNFTEFNISSVMVSSFYQFMDKIWIKYAAKILKDHTFDRGQGHISRPVDKGKQPIVNGHDVLENNFERVAIELLSPVKFFLYKKFLAENSYMHFISHPKMIARYHHKWFEKFLEHAFITYEVETDFKKFI